MGGVFPESSPAGKWYGWPAEMRVVDTFECAIEQASAGTEVLRLTALRHLQAAVHAVDYICRACRSPHLIPEAYTHDMS